VAAARHLRDLAKKVAEVKMVQGVVERPRARREVGRCSFTPA